MASMSSFFSARPVETIEFYDVCRKYDVTPFHVEEFCINRYKHKETGEIYYIENHCQCAVNDRCDICFDFEILELYHNPNHYKCRVCARLEKFYMAQCEFWYRYKLSPKTQSMSMNLSYKGTGLLLLAACQRLSLMIWTCCWIHHKG